VKLESINRDYFTIYLVDKSENMMVLYDNLTDRELALSLIDNAKVRELILVQTTSKVILTRINDGWNDGCNDGWNED
jgi:hypothetical protein